MNILIAPDSFKESLDAIGVCRAIQEGFSQVYPEANYTLLPLADGGEGTSEVLSYVLDGQWREIDVHDPLMRAITAKYLLTADATAVIEIAEACGLHLLADHERNPLIASSYGVGEMILDAINQGAKQILIGLGGSATNDAGTGMLQALGVKILDASGKLLPPGGASLIHTHSIDRTALHVLSDIKITVACDVTSPLCGSTGASHVFAPQKGATPEQVLSLDQALSHFADVCQTQSICADSCRVSAGAGAAGGLGFGLMAFCAAELKSGFDTIADAVALDKHLTTASLVITGEGKLDSQTAMGKVASGVARQARAHNVPVMAICGSVDRHYSLHSKPSASVCADSNAKAFAMSPFDVVVPSIQKLDSLDKVMAEAYSNVAHTAYQLAVTLKIGQQLNL